MEFEKLAQTLLASWQDYLPDWLPGGKLDGKEYTCGDLRGSAGDSLKVNTNTGVWCDFATGEKGGDLVSLYAAIYGLKQGEAYIQLRNRAGTIRSTIQATKAKQIIDAEVPSKRELPNFSESKYFHPKYGKNSDGWTYRTPQGNPWFFQLRYETESGKQFCPWIFSNKRWIPKGPPAPRPLYNLHLLSQNPTKPVVVCEGEKAADAANRMMWPHYVSTTWMNGTNGWKKADLSTLKGRNLLLWPDNDAPGIEAMKKVAEKLQGLAASIKIIDVTDLAEKQDAADLLADEWDWPRLLSWAKPRAKSFSSSPVPTKQAGEPQRTSTPKVSPAPAYDVEVLEPMPEPPEYLAEMPSLEEIEGSVESYIDNSKFALWEQYGISVNDKGKPFLNADNVERILASYPAFKGKLWFDTFTHRYKTCIDWNNIHAKTAIREWGEPDDRRFLIWMQRQFGMPNMKAVAIREGVLAFADQTPRNEVLEWIESLKWDGVSRIDAFLVDAFGAVDLEYTRAASKNFWISMVARILRPGCKVDNMLILEGEQGIKKSTALDVIAGGWFGENGETLGSKDFQISIQGKLIVEFAELDYFRKSDIETLKRVVSCRVDRFRPPYGKTEKDFPRQCVFVGTTNKDEYLHDETGSRRFWPVTVKETNLDYITTYRDQFFAEAAFRFKAHETWWEMPDLQTREQQELRRDRDEREEIIFRWLSANEIQRFSLWEVAWGALNIPSERLDRKQQLELGKLLRQMGCEKKKSNGVSVWVPPETIPELPETEIKTPLRVITEAKDSDYQNFN